MKKKIILILVVVLLVLSLTLCACDTNNNSGGGNGDGGNGDGGNGDYGIENLDILTLALGRLENADLNFTFNVGNSVSKVASVASDATPAASLGQEYWHFTPDDMVTNQIDYDPFEDDQSMMDIMSTDARNIVDDLIDNITVMNTPIYKYGTFYYLNYDASSDTVSAIIYQDSVAEQNAPKDDDNGGSNGESSSTNGNFGGVGGGSTQPSNPTGNIIKIYYDENGNETVEYTQYNEHDGIRDIYHIVYAKDVKYTIINSSNNFDSERNINYTQAVKVNGKWCAIKMNGINPNSYVLDESKPLGEQYAGINIEIFQESEQTSYYYKDSLLRDENGMYIYTFGYEAPGINYIPNNDSRDMADIQINLCLLDGWDAYHLNMSGIELTQEYGEHYFGNELGFDQENLIPIYDDEDYISFINGIKLVGKDVGNGRYLIDGIDTPIMWYTPCGEDGDYWYADGWDSSYPTHTPDKLFKKHYGDLGGKIQGILSLIYPEAGHVKTDITFNVLGNTPYQQFVSLSMMFEKYGLSWNKDRFDDNFMDFLCDAVRNQSVSENQVFNNLLGVDYTPENIKSFVFDLQSTMTTMNDGFISQIISYRDIDAMSYSSLPKRPDNLGLINLSNNISGSALVSQNGIDFSQISVNVNKGIILSQGKEYTVLTYLASGDNMVVVNAFDIVNYANESFVLTGNSNVALPHIEQDGEYTLVSCIAKRDGDSYVRLSELLSLSVNSFATFSVSNEGVGGTYNDTYSCDNNTLKVIASFDDVQAPSISVEDIVDIDEVGVYDLYFATGQDLTVEGVLAKISVVDNRDGVMVISNQHFIEDGSNMPVYEGYKFENGKTYTLIVKDNAGNQSEIKFLATMD